MPPSDMPAPLSDEQVRQEIETILTDLARMTEATKHRSKPSGPGGVSIATEVAVLEGASAAATAPSRNAQSSPSALGLEKTGGSREAVPPVAQTAPFGKLAEKRSLDPVDRRVEELQEKAFKAQSAADASIFLGNLALLYHQQRKYGEAEALHKRALEFREKFLGPEHPEVARTLNNLAVLYRDLGRYAEAEAHCQRSLEIVENTLGLEHPKVARRLCNLADLYLAQEKYTEAEPLYRRALTIIETSPEPELPAVTASLKNYATFLRNNKRTIEAKNVEARALAIRTRLRH
jgi:tetratricopeptide (TPR) repeat protein